MGLTNVSVYPLPAAKPSSANLSEPQPLVHGFSSKATYSTTKFLALQEYCATASPWRVTAVLVLTPVPAFIGCVLPSLVPLPDPLLGDAAIRNSLLHGLVVTFLITYGTIILTLGATVTSRQIYSNTEAFGIALVTSVANLGCSFAAATYMRFPIPFTILANAIPWGLLLVAAHAVLLRKKFKKYPQLLPSLSRYIMPLTLQSSQFGIYAGLTVLFDRVDAVYQVAMVLVYPLIKFLLKKLMGKYTRALDEMSGEVAISAIEISASLYQSMIMQTAPSAMALCAIMGVDFVQGVITIKYFLGRQMTTPHDEVLSTAMAVLDSCKRGSVDGTPSLRLQVNEADHVVVREALELVTAVDTVLLIEYFEVSVPIVNALFLLFTYHTSSTRYNMRLYNFYENPELVMRSTASVLLYSALQGVSLVVMHFVLKKRHKTSAFHHLAFVLEYHARSIQGKLVAFFPLIFYFTVIHYGADFTLRFDVAALLAEMNPVGP